VARVKRRRGYKRGYPVAVLVGFEDDRAVLWQVFSHVVKLHLTVKLDGKRTDEKALYNFRESVIDALRPALKEGVRSVIVTAPMRTAYAADFLNHVNKHHAYLTQPKNPNRATFAVLIGSADSPDKVAELVKTKEFHKIITETTMEEADNLVNALEKYLSNSNAVVLFSLEEIEDRVYGLQRHEDSGSLYLMLTDKYLADSRAKNRVQRLLQISKNKQVKTRIVESETPAGKRISQFGGIIFFFVPTK
jgi:stalled ribosome rescue protein Dom34